MWEGGCGGVRGGCPWGVPGSRGHFQVGGIRVSVLNKNISLITHNTLRHFLVDSSVFWITEQPEKGIMGAQSSCTILVKKFDNYYIRFHNYSDLFSVHYSCTAVQMYSCTAVKGCNIFSGGRWCLRFRGCRIAGIRHAGRGLVICKCAQIPV